MARLDAKWSNARDRGFTWDHFWTDTEAAEAAGDVTGTGGLAFGFSLAATGTETFTSTGGVSFGFSESGSGTETFTGTGAVAFGFSLAASGTQTESGTGGVTFGFSLAGTGEFGASIPVDESRSGALRPAYDHEYVRTPLPIRATGGVSFGYGIAATGEVLNPSNVTFAFKVAAGGTYDDDDLTLTLAA